MGFHIAKRLLCDPVQACTAPRDPAGTRSGGILLSTLRALQAFGVSVGTAGETA